MNRDNLPEGHGTPTKTLRQKAEMLLRKSRTDISGMSNEEVQSMVYDLQVHQIELKLQNEELLTAQLELANSRDEFSDLYDFAPVGYLTLDDKGVIQLANLTVAGMFGIARSGLLNRNLSDFVKRGFQDELYLHLQSVMGAAATVRCELTMVCGNGDEWVMRMESLGYNREKFVSADATGASCIRTAIIDVTKQRESEAWEVQAERSRLLVENLPAGVIFVDHEQIEINHAAEEITGYARDEITTLDHWFEELFGPRALENRAFFETRRRDGFPIIDVVALRRKDGTERLVRIARHGFDGHVVWLLNDVTEQKQLESHLLDIADQEQRRIGHDLHDGLGQVLTGLTLMADSMAIDLQAQGLKESKVAERIAKQAEFCLEQVRDLARGLNPVEIDSQGLVSALTQLADQASTSYQINCEFAGDAEVNLDFSKTATHLYRIAKEAITNGTKHGKADRIDVQLRKSAEGLVLSVTDNGCGIAESETTIRGIGMRSMSYRADLIGGTLLVEPAESGGTVVTCNVPEPTILPAKI
ncbi:MAG: PAS domain S-box-containing protein [Mariniblastus sp.]|jgi:PAS domain S-box-containing protein